MIDEKLAALISAWPADLAWQPKIESAERLRPFKQVVWCGLGGSALAPGLFNIVYPDRSIAIHRDFGLPAVVQDETLLVLSSYSGETEEVLDSFAAARAQNLNLLVVTTGGRLLAAVRQGDVPHILLPIRPDQPPRLAIAASVVALAAVLADAAALSACRSLPSTLMAESFRPRGEELAARLRGATPIIYTDSRWGPLGYIWKIKFNETGKVPAFANVLPEALHNEVEGWSGGNYHFIFLEDPAAAPPIQKRFDLLAELLARLSLPLTRLTLGTGSQWSKIFTSIYLADWVSGALAGLAGVEPLITPRINDLKHGTLV